LRLKRTVARARKGVVKRLVTPQERDREARRERRESVVEKRERESMRCASKARVGEANISSQRAPALVARSLCALDDPTGEDRRGMMKESEEEHTDAYISVGAPIRTMRSTAKRHRRVSRPCLKQLSTDITGERAGQLRVAPALIVRQSNSSC